jgi:hypothetical protein
LASQKKYAFVFMLPNADLYFPAWSFPAFRRTVLPQSLGQKMDEAGSLKACLSTKQHGIAP